MATKTAAKNDVKNNGIPASDDQRSVHMTFLVVGFGDGLMQHNPASMAMSSQGKLGSKKIPTPLEEAMRGRYLDKTGSFFVFPTVGFKQAMVRGGNGRRIGKDSATTILKSSIFPTSAWTTLLDPETGLPIPEHQYTIDTRRVVLSRGVSVLRSRPLVNPWSALVTFEVDSNLNNPELLVDIGTRGGRMGGIGEYRPSTGGPFGRFTIKHIETLEAPEV